MTVNQAMQKKRESREKAINDALVKTKELDERYPEISKIDSQLSMTSALIIKAIGDKDCDRKINEIKERNLMLQEQRGELLRSYGVDEHYDAPDFECKICNDTGYDGKTFCPCVIKMCARDNYLSSGLGKALLAQTFDSFSLKYYDGKHRENMKEILETCVDYAEGFDGSGENLLFTGGTGLGKTHLSSAIAQRVIDKGYSVIYDSAQNIFDEFEGVHFNKNADNTDRFFKCDLLIIDDLGSEFFTQYTAAVMYQLVNQRLINGRSMILNTNLGSKEILKRYGERIYSRVLGAFDTCVFSGGDIRLLKLGEE